MSFPRWAALLLSTAILEALVPSSAQAARLLESERTRLDFGGHVKSYFIGIWPYDHLLMPDEPFGMAPVDFRLKLEGRVGRWLRYSLHHQATAMVQSLDMSQSGTLMPGFSASASSGASALPEALDLSWSAFDTEDGSSDTGDDSGQEETTRTFTLGGRIDRAFVKLRIHNLDITLGRQPVSFGSAYFFTPMDLVAPFSPVVIDREYKPGVDAVRADMFFGMSGKITAVAAYAGDGESWGLEDLVLAAHGRVTAGLFDLGLFLGEIHRETVLGVDTAGSLGPVAVRGEATLTFSEEEDKPFVRAVIGADLRATSELLLMGELYFQSFGASDPSDYLSVAATDRFKRGEVWSMGRYYGALTATYQLTPLLGLSFFSILNLADASSLLGPGFSWSVAENAELVAGGFIAAGERPDDMDPADFYNEDLTPKSEEEMLASIPVRSEFGLSPDTFFLQLKMYF